MCAAQPAGNGGHEGGGAWGWGATPRRLLGGWALEPVHIAGSRAHPLVAPAGGGWHHPAMPVEAPTPVPGRPSALEREAVVDRLRAGCGQERLSLDTFAARVES